EFRWINIPPGIDEGQRIRPKQFAYIKPYCPASDDKTFRQGLRPIGTHGARVEFLFPNRPRAPKRRNQRKRGQRQRIAPADFSTHPPDAERERKRQHYNGWFA